MIGVSLVKIFDSKVIHNEEESDGYTFLVPKARGGECMIKSCSVEAFGEEIVGKLYKSGKAIDTFPNFEIDPNIL